MKQPKRSLSLEEWLEDIKSHAAAAVEAGNESGACLVSNPQTGENDCVRTDPTTCSKIGGVFVGGPCGPLGTLPQAKKKSAKKSKE
jgi:hypothetical protein